MALTTEAVKFADDILDSFLDCRERITIMPDAELSFWAEEIGANFGDMTSFRVYSLKQNRVDHKMQLQVLMSIPEMHKTVECGCLTCRTRQEV